MRTNRPDYIQRKIDLAEERRRHLLERAPDCRCIRCMSVEDFLSILQARRDAQEEQNGPPPF